MTDDRITRERADRWLAEEWYAVNYPAARERIGPLQLRAYLAGLAQARAARIPEGYALVKIDPTLAMSISGQAAIFDNPLVDEGGENCQAGHVWRAMIAASPKPGETI